jgi:imidazolonepropionase-like amidohydrolase
MSHPKFPSLVVLVLLGGAPSAIFGQDAKKSEGAEPKKVETIAIRGARLFDGTGGAVVSPGVVVVRNDKIIVAGKVGALEIPQGAREIDLGDVTLLPGLIDAHTHIIGRMLGDPAQEMAAVRDPESFGAILGVVNARETLMAGVTTIRNLGAHNFDDMALRKAINDGHIPGPRIRAAGHGLSITSGHGDANGYRPGVLEGSIKTGIANGPDECRAAVRYQIKYGADVIKVMATGGVLSEGDAVGETQYTQEEMRAIVDEATKLGRKVAAHAHGAEGIKIASAAGVASIEHGSFLDEEGASLMARNGTYLVPTLVAGERVEKAAKDGVLKGLRAEKAHAAAEAMRTAIRRAVAHNVPIAVGTDSGVTPHGANAREFQLLVEWGGIDPKDAIVAGTRNGARLLGWDDRIGTLEHGKLADVIAVEGDPTKDIKALGKAVFVMKNGVIHKSPTP